MKLLMTTDTIGGVWTYALELAAALRARGVEIVLATQGAPLSAAQRCELARLDNVHVEESALRVEWMAEPWADLRIGDEWLLELEAKHAPDVVHLNDLTRGALPWRAPALIVAHSCVLSWWRAVRREVAPPAWERYRLAVTHSLAAVDLLVAPTRSMLTAMQELYGAPRRSMVIPNGRDLARFHALDKEPFIFGAGRVWDEAKNLAALGRVADRLAWPVFIAGDAGHPDGGTAHCGRARLVGRLEEPALARWYGAATIYALPARYEPFGLSALEASLAGCALVLGDIPSLREIWRDAAIFVDPFDDDALAAALQRVIADLALRHALVQRSRHIAFQHPAGRMAGRYLRVHEQLAGGRSIAREVTLCGS